MSVFLKKQRTKGSPETCIGDWGAKLPKSVSEVNTLGGASSAYTSTIDLFYKAKLTTSISDYSSSVAMNSEVLIIGNSFNKVVDIYNRNDMTLQTTISRTDIGFGASVDINDNNDIVIGAPGVGKVYVYTYSIGVATFGDVYTSNGNFGISVVINNLGTIIASYTTTGTLLTFLYWSGVSLTYILAEVFGVLNASKTVLSIMSDSNIFVAGAPTYSGNAGYVLIAELIGSIISSQHYLYGSANSFFGSGVSIRPNLAFILASNSQVLYVYDLLGNQRTVLYDNRFSSPGNIYTDVIVSSDHHTIFIPAVNSNYISILNYDGLFNLSYVGTIYDSTIPFFGSNIATDNVNTYDLLITGGSLLNKAYLAHRTQIPILSNISEVNNVIAHGDTALKTVSISSWDGSSVSLINTLTHTTTTIDHMYGTSVSSKALTTVVGAPGEMSSFNHEGIVYVYENYILVQTLISPNAESGGLFGICVSLSGTFLAVGASNELTSSGNVYVYNYSAPNINLLATIPSPTPSSPQGFGSVVIMSGNILIVGNSADKGGSVYVYEWDSLTASFILRSTLTNASTALATGFGNSIAFHGTTLLVGSPLDTASTVIGAGRVFIYEWTGAAMSYRSVIQESTPTLDNNFGYSVSVFNNKLAVSAPNSTLDYPSYNGRVYEYSYDPITFTSTLNQIYRPATTGTPVGDFGKYIKLGANNFLGISSSGGYIKYTNFRDYGNTTNTAVAKNFTTIDNTGIVLDGIHSCLDAGDIISFDTLGTFSIFSEFTLDTPISTEQTILGKYDANGSKYSFKLSLVAGATSTTKKLSLVVYGDLNAVNSHTWATNIDVVTIGEPIQIIVTCALTTFTTTFYINNTVVANTTTILGTGASSGLIDSPSALTIGSDSSFTNSFKGKINEVLFFNSILKSYERDELFKRPFRDVPLQNFNSYFSNKLSFTFVNTWSTAGNLNTARNGLAGAGSQTAALSFGGLDNGVYSQVTETFNVNTWSTTGNLNTPRYRLAGAGTQTSALSFGGSTGVSSPVTEKFNGTIWSTTVNLNTARNGLAGAGTQTSALSFGGQYASSGYSQVTETFNGTIWSTTGNLNTARNILAGVGTQTSALSFGGYSGVSSPVTEKFNVTIWSTTGNLNTARIGLAGAGSQTAALSFGGSTGVYSPVTETFNGTIWSTTVNLNTARIGLAGAGSQTAALSFGGSTGASSPVTEKFNSSATLVTIFTDITSNRDLTLSGTATIASPAGLTLDGSTTAYAIDNNAITLPPSPLTILGWVNIPDNALFNQTIFASSFADLGRIRIYKKASTNLLSFMTFTDTAGALSESFDGVAIPTNIWHFFAITINGLVINMYQDNNAPITSTFINPFATDLAPIILGVTRGATHSPQNYDPLTGNMDNIQIFNSVLTTQQIQDIFNTTTKP